METVRLRTILGSNVTLFFTVYSDRKKIDRHYLCIRCLMINILYTFWAVSSDSKKRRQVLFIYYIFNCEYIIN